MSHRSGQTIQANGAKVNSKFMVEIGYREHARAYKATFYPGVRPNRPKRVVFQADDYLTVLTAFLFLI